MKRILLSTSFFTIFFVARAQTVIVTPTDVLCNGLSNGSLVATMVPPVPNAIYTWSNNAAVGIITGNTVINLPAGTYYVTVTDTVRQKQYIGSATIHEPPVISITTSVSHVTCPGGSNGSIVAYVTGGVPGYTFNWSNGSTSQVTNNLPKGLYNLTVTDLNGCIATTNVNVGEPNPITIIPYTMSPTCNVSNGVIDLSVSGGNPPYQFSWNNGFSGIAVTNVPAGTYTVTVTDNSGCTESQQILLSNLGIMNVSPTIVDVSCQVRKGSIAVSVTGGKPPYKYNWSQNNVNIGNGNSIQNLSPGTYDIKITDSSGCVTFKTYEVKNLAIAPLFRKIDLVCNSQKGRIQLDSISGGTPPYHFAWSNGKTTPSIDSLAVGTYTVTITDAQNCSATETFSLSFIQYSPNFYVQVEEKTPNCATTGDLFAKVHNGHAPFTYLWNNGASDPFIKNMPQGFYSVTVTDSNGCVAKGQAKIQPFCLNTISGFLFDDLNNNCSIDPNETPLAFQPIFATNGSQTYYGWSDSSGFYTIYVPNGNFSVQTDNYMGCSQQLTACGSNAVSFNTLGTSFNLNFTSSNVATYDLSVGAQWSEANPGFDKNYYIYYGNHSNLPFNGTATITMKYDPALVYAGSNGPSPTHNPGAHTLTWTVSNIPAQHYTYNSPLHAKFNVPLSVPVSAVLHTEVNISPTANDCNTANNSLESDQVVTGSYDPNIKEVTPSGDITNNDSILIYTIHFQNTGNDTTHFVTLIDTLPTEIYPSSVTAIAWSHLYSWISVTGLGGVLKISFNPIYLVDSATNEAASKGFITFRVKKKPNLPMGTQIKNKAYIYFDYNPPIITNTVINTIVAPTSVMEIDENIKVKVYPNPFAESTQFEISGVKEPFHFVLYDVNAKIVQQLNNVPTNKFTLSKEGLSAGIYLYKIVTGDKICAQGKLSVY
jgi:uncharacterized repeat protein (TIGR01451 family)